MPSMVAPPLLVVCLCAAWCRLCDNYEPVFVATLARLQADHPGLQGRWLDIEDDADLLGDVDVETFPTVVVIDPGRVRFAGPLMPQAETLERVLRSTLATLDGATPPKRQATEIEALAQRLRDQAAAQG